MALGHHTSPPAVMAAARVSQSSMHLTARRLDLLAPIMMMPMMNGPTSAASPSPMHEL
ncbi:hypothetical protein ACHAW6_003809 [Cyclotella cf. meneghiniana]